MADKTLFESITRKLLYDFSGNRDSLFSQWTAQDMFEQFEKMWVTDDHVRGALRIRKSKAFSFPWDVRPVDESTQAAEVAAFVASVIDALDLETAGDLWTAVPFGFGVNEVVWEQGESLVPVSIKGVHPQYIENKIDGALIKSTITGDIKTWEHPYKYLTLRYDSLFDSPEGMPILAACYWPWVFKRLGFKFWSTLLEKFGIPSLAALFDSEAPVSMPEGVEGDTLSDIASAIATEAAKLKGGGVIALPNIKDLKIMSPTGHGDDYEKFLNMCNNAIAVAILGNTMTMESQSRGSQSLGEVHVQVTEDIGKADAKFIARAIQDVIRWIIDLNYGVDVPAPVFGFDLNGKASWEAVTGAMDRGVPVSLAKIYETLHGYKPLDEDDAFVKPEFEASGEVGMSRRPFVRASLPGRKRTR